MKIDESCLGRRAYTAYCDGACFKSSPLPRWHSLSPEIQAAWENAGKTMYEQGRIDEAAIIAGEKDEWEVEAEHHRMDKAMQRGPDWEGD